MVRRSEHRTIITKYCTIADFKWKLLDMVSFKGKCYVLMPPRGVDIFQTQRLQVLLRNTRMWHLYVIPSVDDSARQVIVRFIPKEKGGLLGRTKKSIGSLYPSIESRQSLSQLCRLLAPTWSVLVVLPLDGCSIQSCTLIASQIQS